MPSSFQKRALTGRYHGRLRTSDGRCSIVRAFLNIYRLTLDKQICVHESKFQSVALLGPGYSPGHAAYTPGLASLTYPAWMADMKPEQQAVLLNPGWPSTMRDRMKPTPEQFEKFAAVLEANGAKL